MKQMYINLSRCTDKNRKMAERFPKATRIEAVDGNEISTKDLQGFRTDGNWRDPATSRRMTKGEIGCILSHINAWRVVSITGEPAIILEDDGVILRDDYETLAEEGLSNHDFIYLSHKEMSGDKTIVNPEFFTGPFLYWANAYALTPKVAKALLAYFDNNPLIPTDEVIPAILGAHWNEELNQASDFKWVALNNQAITPEEGAFEVSDTEISDYWRDFEFHKITVGTDLWKTFMLTDNHNDVINLGKGQIWQGGKMAEGPGGGQKIALMQEYLSMLPDNDIVMFVDGYDTFIGADDDEILTRYLGFNREIVFSAEKTCWPDASMSDQFAATEFGQNYLNSGTYIGTVKELRKMFSVPIEYSFDDQLYCQLRYLTGEFDIALDTESYIFLCLSGNESNVRYSSGYLENSETRCTTAVIHGNGGDATKELLDSMYQAYYSKPSERSSGPSSNIETNKELLDTDIILFRKALSKEWCKELIEACEAENNWHSLPSDLFPGQEMRLNRLRDQRFIEEWREFYKNTVVPHAETHWPMLKMNACRDVFVIKYSEEQQTSLPLHHDMSLVTASAKLNDDYEGAVLNFPRQGVDNSDTSTGDLVLWPGQVTHPHECLPLKSGVKYALVMWSAYYNHEEEYVEEDNQVVN